MGRTPWDGEDGSDPADGEQGEGVILEVVFSHGDLGRYPPAPRRRRGRNRYTVAPHRQRPDQNNGGGGLVRHPR
jgi:hypothetical protein